jgi:2-dehydropantoate 2-reductase
VGEAARAVVARCAVMALRGAGAAGGPASRFIIVGAGALGSLMGGYLAEAGHAVQLVARPDHAERIRRDGLVIKGVRGERRVRVPVSERLDQARPATGAIVFLTCKAQDVEGLAREVAARWGSEIPTVCWQNGVRAEEEAAPHLRRLYAGVAHFAAKFLVPGTVIQTFDDAGVVGRYPAGRDGLCEQIAARLTGVGLPTTVSEAIVGVKWFKLFSNLMATLLAAADLNLYEAMAMPEPRLFMADLLDESLRVVEAAGIPLTPIPGHPPIADQSARLRAGRVPTRDPGEDEELRRRPSIWQDLYLKRGRTEVEYLNGEIVRLAERTGRPAPLNRALVRAVARMARERLAPGAYTIAELRDMARGL